MSLRSIGIRVMVTGLLWGALGTVAHSQGANSRTSFQTFASAGKSSATANSQTEMQATQASAELVKGKLSPAHSKPGDPVAMRLNEDVKSNGQVVLKKGTIINGVVQSAKQVDQKSSANGKAGSMMEIQWLTPEGNSVAGSTQLMFALQSLTQVNRNYQDSSDFPPPNLGSAQSVRSTASGGGGLLGGGGALAAGAAGGAGGVGGLMGGVGGTASALAGTSANAGTLAPASLLAAPGVIAADNRASTTLQHDFGFTGNQQFFSTGSGELVSATGYKDNLNLFSRMSNDTVLTSTSKDFEVTSGAQMQLLVGIERK